MAGGVERVLTLKANYFAEHFGYDITIILTEGKGKPFFYPLSDNVKTVNLDINFERLWTCSFLKKIIVYMRKQSQFRQRLTAALMGIRPDITISLLRREINFINDIQDGSRKIGEIHINRANYRNFDKSETNIVKRLFSNYWSGSLVKHLCRLDRLVVLTESDAEAWVELSRVAVIPDPLSITPATHSPLTEKRVVCIARYSHEKGIDLLLRSWKKAETASADWRLDVYGDGNTASYEQLIDELHINRGRCQLHGRTSDVEKAYFGSSIFVLSSRFEGFGLVLVEAMACGLPVVAFDCPWGPRSIIRDGEDGLLAAAENPDDLADKLLLLMADEALRQRMSDTAIKNVQRFRIEQIAEKWRLLFEDVLNEKSCHTK